MNMTERSKLSELEMRKAEAWEDYYIAKTKADDRYKIWSDLRNEVERTQEEQRIKSETVAPVEAEKEAV